MTLFIEYKCEQNNPKHITIKHKIYQAYKEISNVNMQDISTSQR